MKIRMMEKNGQTVFIIHWIDPYVPESNPLRVGIASCEDNARRMGEEFVDKHGGVCSAMEVQLDKVAW